MARTRIKICGVRTFDDALACVNAGADAIGFVFAEPSPRFIDPVDAWVILSKLPPFIDTVGLFVDLSPAEHAEHVELCPTDYSQLHGSETEAVVRACGPRVIKAIRFAPTMIARELEQWSRVEEVDAILVDGSSGGRGESFDWKGLAAARSHAGSKPLIVAGGLTPANVGEAVRAVRPYAVDVSSGVEKSPGVKDFALIEAFCRSVHAADERG